MTKLNTRSDLESQLKARDSFIGALHAIADLYEQNPEMEVPSHCGFAIFPPDGTHMEYARVLKTFEKETSPDSSFFKLIKKIGPIEMRVCWYREAVCTRRQTGTKTVERRVPVGEVRYETKAEEVPIYEWDCPPELLKESPHDQIQSPEDHAKEKAEEKGDGPRTVQGDGPIPF